MSKPEKFSPYNRVSQITKEQFDRVYRHVAGITAYRETRKDLLITAITMDEDGSITVYSERPDIDWGSPCDYCPSHWQLKTHSFPSVNPTRFDYRKPLYVIGQVLA
jgi:hypothetical protein